MLTKVLLILLGTFIILPSRIEGPHVESEKGPSASDDDVYGPKPQAPDKELPPEEIKPTAIDTHDRLGKMPTATEILDGILNNYDYKLRPGIGERPTVVTVELSVNTLGPISILDMEYTIDITFYQTWYDERLRFNGSFESFVLNGNLVSLLWIPDTFFRNSKRTQEHSITMPNQMVRIHKDGKVLYTIRRLRSHDAFLQREQEVWLCGLSKLCSFFCDHDDLLDFLLDQERLCSGQDFFRDHFCTHHDHFGHLFPEEFPTCLLYHSLGFLYCDLLHLLLLCSDGVCCAQLPDLQPDSIPWFSETSSCMSWPRAHARDPTPSRVRVIEHPEAFVCDIEDPEEEEESEEEESEEEEGPSCPARQSVRPGSTPRPGGCCKWCEKYCCTVPTCEGSTWQQGRLFIHVYRLDNYSRVIFPVTFFFFNVLYWLICLNL
ncbi:gamma-aminobutyric acid receptor subunit epsilon isoform X4 [Globicephala melas]|uniref:gamma-aminobutyric acid receptor subunit epsilon isoform X4 n=1 Tax=Globicephala melas TaxID=9731 RepID=UPI00293D8FA2|nr:gamma-aminobutyric acid receptor subunit epsilon isoform X4 [Globicephala melas]